MNKQTNSCIALEILKKIWICLAVAGDIQRIFFVCRLKFISKNFKEYYILQVICTLTDALILASISPKYDITFLQILDEYL